MSNDNLSSAEALDHASQGMQYIFTEFRKKASAQELAAFLSGICIMLEAMGPDALTNAIAHMAHMFSCARNGDTDKGHRTTDIGNILVQNGAEGFALFLFGQRNDGGNRTIEDVLATMKRITDGAEAAGAEAQVVTKEVNAPSPSPDLN